MIGYVIQLFYIYKL